MKGPQYLRRRLSPYVQTCSLRSNSQKPLKVPHILRMRRGYFAYLASKLWNALPFALKSSFIESVFRRNLKTHLFNVSL